MQNKGLIKLFAILFGLVSLYQLSFTYFTNGVEDKAKMYAESKSEDGKEIARLEGVFLDSVANKPVIDLGFAQFSYNDIKDKELNLGLDLKGGINAILQVSVKDILIGLSNESKNPVFNEALAKATIAQKSSDKRFLDLFFNEFEKASAGSVNLSDPSIFGNKSLREKINFKLSDEEVMPIIEAEVTGSVNTAFEVLRSRIDKFGVTQPNIQRIGNSGRILIELPGAKDIDRVKKLLQSTAELQFWEVYSNQETANFFFQANSVVENLLKVDTEIDTTTAKDDLEDLLGEVSDSLAAKPVNNLFSVLSPSIPQSENQVSSVIGTAKVLDTAKVNSYLAMREVRALLPNEMKYAKFLWDAKPFSSATATGESVDLIYLYGIKSNREDVAPIEGDVIDDASQEYGQTGKPEVSMTMNAGGSRLWGKMTTENVGQFVAVVLDDYVYTAPSVNTPITTGRTSISGGSMTVEEAQDIANVLKAGKLPAAAHIIQSEVVGPSLGQKAIDSSMSSFGLALLLVLLWMIFYYGKAGAFADVALAVNILFIFGILTAFGAVLTLPGIAGIILTIGMSVDANVIIFERIKEELNKGKGLKASISHGFSFKGALSAIIDANITTMLTGVILYVFGTGPVKGFAYTLMVGIVTSLFTAIFITRLLIDWYAAKGKSFTFNTSITKNWFKRIDIEFLRKRKIAYVISGIVIIGGLTSLLTNGLNYGVDFIGGRSYVVKFDKPTNATDVAETLKDAFGSAPEVKTYGEVSQLKITTKYKIDIEGSEIDDEVQGLLFTGLKSYLPEGLTLEKFKPGYEGIGKVGIMSSMKVEPTIADDIKTAAGWAILGSLLITFLYILFRFRKWQYSLGAVAAVFHDVLIVLAIFSVFHNLLPFDMEIGQSFIAAILTVVGYSLNDTVVIFDRIREFAGIHTSWKFSEVVDKALSSTLGRTINTSLTTLVVLLAIFLFGGDSIKGFMFALIVGVMVGTYSSLFIASPIMYDTVKKMDSKK
ncbi:MULTISPECIES: protein translocase subunit SecDF [Flavobacteriaceae]|uniref:Multifunctional fusion protein n=2 Tax=Flavobacteriaceae TaxID=49546 RepID=A0A4Y8AUX2_9FLAO|nr:MULTISPECIES: protein translocase subunit SecDF [Flavobacteriaceae]TEW75273.1 protein translocase subunit SecDF [Gramella jeungdoensis]GGK43837.1 protein translocase subunit SecDF [Lutibacter litoralis]